MPLLVLILAIAALVVSIATAGAGSFMPWKTSNPARHAGQPFPPGAAS